MNKNHTVENPISIEQLAVVMRKDDWNSGIAKLIQDFIVTHSDYIESNELDHLLVVQQIIEIAYLKSVLDVKESIQEKLQLQEA